MAKLNWYIIVFATQVNTGIKCTENCFEKSVYQMHKCIWNYIKLNVKSPFNLLFTIIFCWKETNMIHVLKMFNTSTNMWKHMTGTCNSMNDLRSTVQINHALVKVNTSCTVWADISSELPNVPPWAVRLSDPCALIRLNACNVFAGLWLLITQKIDFDSVM